TGIDDDESRGYFGLGLGLLGDPQAREILLQEVRNARRRPLLLQQAAIGLGLLSNPNAVPVLVEQLKAEETLYAQAAVATALGYVGDQRSLRPLIEMARDESLAGTSRGLAIAALGRVADKEPLPWNSKISSMANYRALTMTLIGTNGGTGLLDIL
ncbi:MAG TPA: HEAT repeat domain-containing protein, partial [Planctomycetota bacterium]|nr:HEAT repeat domain-containing protein [Planctomycetota bacterium]